MTSREWNYRMKDTNMFKDVQKETKKFKCKICLKKFAKAGFAQKHMEKEHPKLRNPQTQICIIASETATKEKKQGLPRKRKKKKKKGANKKRKTEKLRKQMGMPIMRYAAEIHYRLAYAKKYKSCAHGKKSRFAKKVGVPERTLRNWVKNMDRYEKCRRRTRYYMKKKRVGKFFSEQVEVFKQFNARRQKGGKVDHFWLRKKMKFMCEKRKHEAYDPQKHKFTQPWSMAYCKRWNISQQRKTNKKSKSVLERINLVCNFMYYMIYVVARTEGNDTQ